MSKPNGWTMIGWGALLEAVADHPVTIWSALVRQAVQRFHIDLEDLHADTTSVHFEGVYEKADGSPKGGGDRIPLLVEGYNKDGQRRKVQLVSSLITQGRLPLWYCPWNGNQTMVSFCRQPQLFLAAHPWTDTAKSVWQETW